MISVRSRCQGALVGTLAGDVLGAPYETWKRAAIAEDWAQRGGLVLFDYKEPFHGKRMLPAGRPTDDSEQTIALAQALTHDGTFDEERFYTLLRKTLLEEVSLLWNGPSLGGGRTSRAAVEPATYAEAKIRRRSEVYYSNGALMRAAPLALVPLHDKDVLARDMRTKLVIRASMVTHVHPWSIDAAIAYVHTIRALIDGKSLGWALAYARHACLTQEVAEITTASERPEDPGGWPEWGSALHTLRVALWASQTAADFRDGISRAISVGGDTDTYAAVTGGILGTLYGVEAIPEEWRAFLKGLPEMASAADRLSMGRGSYAR